MISFARRRQGWGLNNDASSRHSFSHPVSSFCQRGASKPLVILSITRHRGAVRLSALTEPRKESTVSPFLRQFAKLPPLNLQDASCLAFFLTRSRCVIPVLQRVLISLRRAVRFPPVHPTAAVFHRCRSARLSSALRSSPAARAQMRIGSLPCMGLSTFAVIALGVDQPGSLND